MAGMETENLIALNTLVLSSLEFLFRYLPVFLILFCIAPKRYRSGVLFGFSLLLYAAGEPKYAFLLLGMTVMNYLFGRCLEMTPGQEHDIGAKKRRKLLLFLSAACNFSLLIYFKISNAFDASFLLPVGISFYVFKSVSYLVDVYRLEVDAEHSFLRFGAYLSNFFQIVSGPIMRYCDAQRGLKYGNVTCKGLEEGLKKLIIGFGAKVLLADRLGVLWNDIQTIGFESISTPLAWLGVIAYSLQLYYDFAGYSLMAVGIGEMIGFPVIVNFDQPYASRSVSEFYRRWHITLGRWFRDYVYIPLGGSRRGVAKTVRNLLVVWLLTGFWHGNSVNFVIWGLVLAVFIISEKLWLGKILQRHPVCSHLYVLFVIPLTWVIFAIPSLQEIGIYYSRLFPLFSTGTAVNPGDFSKELGIFAPTLAAAGIFCIPVVEKWYHAHRKSPVVTAALVILFWTAVYRVAVSGNNPFMYANF